MGALRIALLAILLVVPGTLGQPTPNPSTVGDTVNPLLEEAIPAAENETGEDLTHEEIGIKLLVDIQNAELDTIGMLFGGGKAETDMDVQLTLAFRAVHVSRLEQAMQEASGEANLSLSGTFGINTSRTVLTADEVRAAAGGAVLEAFKGFQQAAAERYLEETIPQVTVLSSRFDWRNTAPEREPPDPDDPRLREPPIVLEANMTLRFLDRFSLVDVLEAQGEDEGPDPEEDLRRRIEENQTVPFRDRSAFVVLGIGQLVSMDLPPGWRLNLTVSVPQGFTISSATDALVVSDDRQRATYYLDGSHSSSGFRETGVVTISDRFLVTSVVLGAALLVGLLARFPVELAVLAGTEHWRRSRAKDSDTRHEAAHRE